MAELSNQPVKGTTDWFPDEFQIRKYIFDSWREVCTRFGYQEYMTPVVEAADIYRAKSGEDVGGKELMVMTDRAGRELAIRPEMTPSVTRMISRKYESLPKPIRYFSIANFLRNEKPQRGRNREFWQLNFDIFGADGIEADIEVIQLALEIMLKFSPPADSFVVYINNRKLIDAVLDKVNFPDAESKQQTMRTLDKWEKLELAEFQERLAEIGLSTPDIERLVDFMQSETEGDLIEKLTDLGSSEGVREVQEVMKALNNLGYSNWIEFKPNVIRGFDYYDGIVFEVFDKNPDNNRAMFGGGRYNGLAGIFGGSSFPAVGCAPGDETTRLFLESWGLVDQIADSTKQEVYYLPVLDESVADEVRVLALNLRREGKNVVMGMQVEALSKALENANKQGYSRVVIFGVNEVQGNIYLLKDMESGEQKEIILSV